MGKSTLPVFFSSDSVLRLYINNNIPSQRKDKPTTIAIMNL